MPDPYARWVRLGLVLWAGLLVYNSAALQGKQATAPKNGSLEGRVLTEADKQPVRGVEVRARSEGKSQTTVTDDSGHFKFADLAPGAYELLATKLGFVSLWYGQSTHSESGRKIDVLPRAHLTGLDFFLPRAAVITVRVMDLDGQPRPGMVVDAVRMLYVDGKRKPSPTGGMFSGSLFPATTDDRGERRIFGLPAGEYFVFAKFSGSEYERGRPERFFHPDVTSFELAQVVMVGAGDEVVAPITMSAVRRGTITAAITSASGSQLSAVVSYLIETDSLGTSGIAIQRKSDSGFSASEVPPGRYTAFVSGKSAVGNEFGATSWVFTGEDQTIAITTRPTGTLNGRILFDGGGQLPKLGSLKIVPEFFAGGVSPGESQIRADWSFQIRNVAGVGILRLNDGSRQWLVDRIMVGGQDVSETELDFQSDLLGRSIDVYLTQKHSTFSGTAVDLKGAPARDYTVVVFPQDTNRWLPRSPRIRTARADDKGGFELRGLPVENYLVVALDRIEIGREFDKDTLERLRTVARRLPSSVGETKQLTLQVMSLPR